MTAVKRIPVTITGQHRSSEFHAKIYGDTICISKTRWMEEERLRKRSLTKSLALVITKLHASLTSALNCNQRSFFHSFRHFPFGFFTPSIRLVSAVFSFSRSSFSSAFSHIIKAPTNAKYIYSLYETLELNIFHESAKIIRAPSMQIFTFL